MKNSRHTFYFMASLWNKQMFSHRGFEINNESFLLSTASPETDAIGRRFFENRIMVTDMNMIIQIWWDFDSKCV